MAGERDQNQDVTIAVIKNDVDYIKKEVGGISGKLEILEKNYIRRSEVEALKKDADDTHGKMEQKIELIALDLAVFKAQVKTWGAAGILLLGLLQFAISTFL